MMSVHVVAALLTILTGSSSSGPGRQMDLVRDGRAVAVIVVNEPAAPSQRKGKPAKGRGFVCSDSAAANVLADWIEKITDVRLPIIERSRNYSLAGFLARSC